MPVFWCRFMCSSVECCEHTSQRPIIVGREPFTRPRRTKKMIAAGTANTTSRKSRGAMGRAFYRMQFGNVTAPPVRHGQHADENVFRTLFSNDGFWQGRGHEFDVDQRGCAEPRSGNRLLFAGFRLHEGRGA